MAVQRGVRDAAVGAGGVECGLADVFKTARHLGGELVVVASESGVASVDGGRHRRCS